MIKTTSCTCTTCGSRLFAGACITCKSGIAATPR
jgi:hypothetical protein